MINNQIKIVGDIFKGRLRGNQLMASGVPLIPGSARLLWASPRMMEVTWLDLGDNQLGDEGVQDLANCELLINVQYLNLSKNGITDKGLSFLAKSKYLTNLKRLHLKNNSIQGSGLLSLFNSVT